MDHDLFEGAACATSDLTARLLADLACADERLALAEARMRAVTVTGVAVPSRLRAEHRQCRTLVASLRQVLAGMPGFDGGPRAALA